MSAFNENPVRGEAVLVARGAPGVELQIVDTDYHVLARGTGELKMTLPDAVYMINWISKGQAVQKLVRLLPIERPLIVAPDASPGAGPTEALGTLGAGPKQAFVLGNHEIKTSSEFDRGSEVAVIIRGSSSKPQIDLDKSLRLINSDDVAMWSDKRSVAMLQKQTDGYAARFYHVPPGDFRLRYISTNGETFDQTVPAMKDRRTVAFVTAGTGKVLMAEDGAYKPINYNGMDPTRTIMVSIPRSGPAIDPTEGLRLAEILLHDLAVGRGSLGAAFIAGLNAAGTDPLLRLYAAAVVLTRLDWDSSPALDERWPVDRSAQDAFRKRWQDLAASWLTSTLQQGALPDVTAALWRLQTSGKVMTVPPLSCPPMLECSWLWAVARSTHDSEAIPSGVGFRAAGRNAGGTAPWLTWRTAAAKGDIAVTPDAGTDDLGEAIGSVAAKVQQIFEASETNPSHDQISDPLAFLSPESKAMAVKTFEVNQRTRSPNAAGKRGDNAVAELATLFGVPAPQLRQMLLSTLAELNAQPMNAAGIIAADHKESPPSDPPALRRRILSPDDPNKGRFGGQSTKGDFELYATFHDVEDKDWVRIKLTVRHRLMSAIKGEDVEFFLHDSFRPNRLLAPFGVSTATHEVVAWGGFTVGAWLPSRNLELELDLAEVPGAPHIIRDR